MKLFRKGPLKLEKYYYALIIIVPFIHIFTSGKYIYDAQTVTFHYDLILSYILISSYSMIIFVLNNS